MNKKVKKKYKKFVKFLLLAQANSDGGKIFSNLKDYPSESLLKAYIHGYEHKVLHIRQAVELAKDLPNSLVKVSWGVDNDINMTVIYFDLGGYGQVSFHTPEIESWDGIPKTGVWKPWCISRVVCARLAKKFNLPFYPHK